MLRAFFVMVLYSAVASHLKSFEWTPEFTPEFTPESLKSYTKMELVRSTQNTRHKMVITEHLNCSLEILVTALVFYKAYSLKRHLLYLFHVVWIALSTYGFCIIVDKRPCNKHTCGNAIALYFACYAFDSIDYRSIDAYSTV